MMRLLWAVEKAAMSSRNTLFQEEDKPTYVGEMMRRIVGAALRAGRGACRGTGDSHAVRLVIEK